MVIKVIIRILKAILIFAALLILSLGIVGGGWGPKEVPASHPFYSGKLRLIAHRGVTDTVPENTFASA